VGVGQMRAGGWGWGKKIVIFCGRPLWTAVHKTVKRLTETSLLGEKECNSWPTMKILGVEEKFWTQTVGGESLHVCA